MTSEEQKGPQRTTLSRRKKTIALAIVTVVVAVVACAYVIVLSRSSAGVTLLVTHYDPAYADVARVAFYIDDALKEEFDIDPGSNYTILFKLGHGTHTIGFDYAIAPSAEPDGVIDAEFSVEISDSSFHGYEYRWSVGSSRLIQSY